MSTPEWIKALGDGRECHVPHIGLTGPERGVVRYLDRDAAARVVQDGTHLCVAGRDMTTLDLDAEAARIAEARRAKAPAASDVGAEQAAADAAAEVRKARVGRYANRALITKTGEGK